MKSFFLTPYATLCLAGVLSGCHHMPTHPETSTVSVTEVLNALKTELNAFANEKMPTGLPLGKACTGVTNVSAETVTVTLTTVGVQKADGSVSLGIPVFEANLAGSSSDMTTSKVVLPLKLATPSGTKTQDVKDMPLASALIKLRNELLAVNSAQMPCLTTEADKRISLELSFEAIRTGEAGVKLNVVPLKLGTTRKQSTTATQTVAIGLRLEGKDGKPVTLETTPASKLQ
ncbi:MAG: trypco2 family protein [Hydrogenophaga sp.]|nr:trypco2 family protein [Hydrogenophaga sp.]